MIQTLADLRRSGDTIRCVEGVLSGTLSYVFDSVNRGVPFSAAVREAAKRGFTEPHPAMDLSGEDVARKLLILAREAGYTLERDQIHVEGLVPAELGSVRDTAEYLRHLARFDAEWSARAAASAAGGNRLTYLARFDGTNASVGTAEVPRESPFVHLRASENSVHYYTDRHSPHPIAVTGIGAGPDVTARGVLADVIHTALELAA
jgi:aspartokinase/homoserine dehydrogenase 1